MEISDKEKLDFHLKEVLADNRKFENAARSVSRMMLEKKLEKTTIAGRTSYEFNFFREGKKHLIGWHEEINDFVNFVKDAAEGGSSKEMAFVLVGEPGNGKTFFVEYICTKYRQFIARPENRRYTFNFVNIDHLEGYGNIRTIQSQTFEDPVLLCMNLFESQNESKEYLAKAGFDDVAIERLYADHNPLGACSEYIWSAIRNHCDGDIEKMLGHIQITPVPISDSLGTLTGKYSAKDKITSSADDLLGKRDISRVLQLADSSNPYVYNRLYRPRRAFRRRYCPRGRRRNPFLR